MKQLVEDGNYGSRNEQRIEKIIERYFYEDAWMAHSITSQTN